ncbi:alpha/beta fold hydrolase [Streptomyces sp. AN091965]|uniref:alpha/beta fold hydrolase n=1 Tax=Streptomyces sp. AN091965 TaxID=2927803 RepID=UPI001F61E3D0|nr:alpha/beta hydrolase [Streptomyces sp. AN091965]MCI3928152.1 alpha/beta hydrolase [Streptomyces sp. AN091965]
MTWQAPPDRDAAARPGKPYRRRIEETSVPEIPCIPVGLLRPDGARLALYLRGPRDPDLVLILAHGWQATSGIWDKTVEQLVRPTTLVVRYDQRGHGRSTTGTARPAMSLLADDLQAVIAATAPGDVPVVLVGHSMGGAAALTLAATRPGLFGDKVIAMLLAASSSGGLDLAAAGHPLPTRLIGLMRHVMASMCIRAPGMALRLHNLWQPRLSTQPPMDVAARWFKALMRHDVTELEALRRIPVHILVGEDDPTIPPAHSHRLVQQIPTARLHVVPRGCHRLPTRHSSHVVTAIELTCSDGFRQLHDGLSPLDEPADTTTGPGPAEAHTPLA